MNKFKIISFLILTSFSSFSFAGAAEDRTQSIIDKALSTKTYSSASGNSYTVGGVKADNGKLVATVAQRVVVDGSAATVTQKVTIPANDAFYKKTAGFAKNLLKGGLYSAAAAVAMKGLLDGVDYVMGEGGKISKPYVSDGQLTSADPLGYRLAYAALSTTLYFSSKSAACAYYASHEGAQLISTGYNFCTVILKNGGQVNSSVISPNPVSNPKYIAGSNPPPNVPTPVSDAEIDDAFSNWFKNNSGSVTDPVTTYIYSPKTPTGAPATTPQKDPSFGQQEITDDMMNNYLENRNAELFAADVAARQAAVQDSAEIETQPKPDPPKIETKSNPDGSKIETKTETKINPDTGEFETIVTETVINPDGSRGEPEIKEKIQTKPNPETSKLPAACEYFAVLCDWIGWTKENPDMPEDDPLVPHELDIGSLNTGTFQATAGCPADIQVPVSFGGASKSIAISYEPICALAQKWSFIAPLIGFISGAMILIGVGRKGEDGDS